MAEPFLPDGESVVAVVVAEGLVVLVGETGVSWCQGVAATIGRFGDDVQCSRAGAGPIGAEEAGGEALCGLDVAGGTTGPEIRGAVGVDQVVVAGAEFGAGRKGLGGTGVGTGGCEIFKGGVGEVGEVGPVVQERERAVEGTVGAEAVEEGDVAWHYCQ